MLLCQQEEAGYNNQRAVNVAEARENVGNVRNKRVKDAAYHKEKMLLCKQEEAGVQLADLFTKALSEDRFKYLVRRLGMRCLTPDELEVLAIESA
ncbi:hypothetical protein Tco_0081221 [Tanacetum coccineum]